ncbi:phosphoglycerate mutase family protein [Colletotrichum truncatum]|uniref:Phosphoglycerate mutase family protein n=1 Tax=Colletotrichum truncatum TaxID=5467 RepID=A0ACC3ZBG5_COLTU|nr:phosphoglycerate mutase family protein [Colletotrichum truncatum]KAF6787762.1 phosphoglycerate mutase family protein [Colletotrichum truncatum]
MGAIHLYLVRHGESVDNVANLYAGSRDASLTSHGVLQARRLGTHLSSRTASAPVSHIFASNLQRAFRTAEAIRDALSTSSEAEVSTRSHVVEVVQLPELREKHFGSGEGQKVGARSVGERHVGAETHEAMFARAKRFVSDYLAPIFACVDAVEAESESVVVVAHGIILGVLARVLRSTSYFGTVVSTPEDQMPLAWSNTGYVEVHITASATSKTTESKQSDSTPTWPDLSFKTITVNCTDHLQGLKKTRGGIGSAKHDEKQKTLNAFFTPTAKKRKHDDET